MSIMKILLLDNYDSFTYNLVHLLRSLNQSVDVIRNDKIALEGVKAYDKIVLSPGPGIPDEAGIIKDVVREYGPTKSILGVCLGHQGIAEVYGGKLFNMPIVRHGVTCALQVVDASEALYRGIPERFAVAQYHSWAVEANAIPGDLKVTARNEDGLIMSIAHRKYDVRGVQFHPESIMTEYGKEIMSNWLSL
jgi:anthranilate synthase component 2